MMAKFQFLLLLYNAINKKKPVSIHCKQFMVTEFKVILISNIDHHDTSRGKELAIIVENDFLLCCVF